MILFIGSSKDKVYPRMLAELERSGHPFAVLDEDRSKEYRVQREDKYWKVYGDGCDGKRAIGAIFVRHAVARTLDPDVVEPMSRLQASLNHMLLESRCPVVNPPSRAYSNYSKPYQLGLLARAGFDVPKTLVTNIPAEALRFHQMYAGGVIFKGASNVMSYAQVWKQDHFERIKFLPNSPTQFQEYVAGADYRVHVIGEETFVTRLSASNEDYRRSALADQEEIIAEPGVLRQEELDRCVRFTRSLGLVIGGIDFKQTAGGRLVALELNPYPQFTFYEGRSGQPITRAVVSYLTRHQEKESNIFA